MMVRRLLVVLVAATVLAVSGYGGSVPDGLHKYMGLGLDQVPCQSWSNDANVNLDYVYTYMTGEFSSNWYTWGANGQYATDFFNRADALLGSPIPVAVFEQIVGNGGISVMTNPGGGAYQYYESYHRLLIKAAAYGKTVVIHIEPDAWGFWQDTNSDASMIPIRVTDSGYAPVAAYEYPDNLIGFAHALIRLRNDVAPNVRLAYHWSHWGGNGDVFVDTSSSLTDLVNKVKADARFMRSLTNPGIGIKFDLFFSDPADRDADYFAIVRGDGGARWWDPVAAPSGSVRSFARVALMLDTFSTETDLRGMLWQIPEGNTFYRTCNNEEGHFRDNRINTFLPPAGEDPGAGYVGAFNGTAAYTSNGVLEDFADSGIIGLLFGSGTLGFYCDVNATTHHRDFKNCPEADHCAAVNMDGITNPVINIDSGVALSVWGNHTSAYADDDGGYIRLAYQHYASEGAMDTVPDLGCDPGCGMRGTCDHATRTCVCETPSQYAGPSCDDPVCAQGCVHGTCTAPGVCECEMTWSGDACDIADVCDPDCINGVCHLRETCVCHPGWHGPLCAHSTCSPACTWPMFCTGTSPSVCSCPERYTSSADGVCDVIVGQRIEVQWAELGEELPAPSDTSVRVSDGDKVLVLDARFGQHHNETHKPILREDGTLEAVSYALHITVDGASPSATSPRVHAAVRRNVLPTQHLLELEAWATPAEPATLVIENFAAARAVYLALRAEDVDAVVRVLMQRHTLVPKAVITEDKNDAQASQEPESAFTPLIALFAGMAIGACIGGGVFGAAVLVQQRKDEEPDNTAADDDADDDDNIASKPVEASEYLDHEGRADQPVRRTSVLASMAGRRASRRASSLHGVKDQPAMVPLRSDESTQPPAGGRARVHQRRRTNTMDGDDGEGVEYELSDDDDYSYDEKRGGAGMQTRYQFHVRPGAVPSDNSRRMQSHDQVVHPAGSATKGGRLVLEPIPPATRPPRHRF